MSRWESPTFNSCLVNNSLKVEHLPFGVGSAPQGGTQHFSHHAFAITGAEVPAWSREHAWRFAYFFDDESGATTMNKEGKNRKPLTLEEKKRKEEAGHKAWQAFVEKEAPKRLANRKPLPNDPTAYREIKGGKPMPEDKFLEWKKEKELIQLKAKQAEDGEMEKIREDVNKMMEKRLQSNKNMTQQVTSDGKKKTSSNKQKAIQQQLILLKKQNNPLSQKVRLRLPKVDKGKKKKEFDNSISDYSSFEGEGDMNSPSRKHNNNGGGRNQLAKSGASIMSNQSSNGSMSPSRDVSDNQTSASNTRSLAYPPNLLNMANMAQVTRNPIRTPTATAAKALILEEALDVYVERKNNNTSGGDGAQSMTSAKKKSKGKSGGLDQRREWDGRFSVPPETDKIKKKNDQKKNNNNRIPVFANTMPNPTKSNMRLKEQHKQQRQKEEAEGNNRTGNGRVVSEGEDGSPRWGGFSGEGEGGDGSGDGVSGEPWDYQEYFAGEQTEQTEQQS